MALPIGVRRLLRTRWSGRIRWRPRSPGERGSSPVEFAIVAPVFFLLLFASTYFTLSDREPTTFSETLSRTDALYFTMTVLSTVGFGDIAPQTPVGQVLAAALTQARDARLAILDVMAEAIAEPEEMSLHAPRIITVKVPVDKIGEVIGPKGKVINQIQDDTGAQISIEDDGTIYIGATNGESAEAARTIINGIANPTMPEVGERYLGTVVKTTNFGAFVSLLPGKDGLLHISKLRALAGGKRVEAVEDVLSVGQKVQVQIAEIDDRGKLSLVPVVDESEGASDESAEDSDGE